MTGRQEETRKILAQLTKRREQSYFPAILIGFLHFGLGDEDQGFAWFETAYGDRDALLALLKVSPFSDPYRSDPRFQDLLKRMNFPE